MSVRIGVQVTSKSQASREGGAKLAPVSTTALQPQARGSSGPAAPCGEKRSAQPSITESRSLAMDNLSEPNRRTVLGAAGAFGLAVWAAPGAAAPARSGAVE